MIIKQNIKCYSSSRLLAKYLKGDNVYFTYPYMDKLMVNGQLFMLFPNKLKNILSKFSEEVPFIYSGYKTSETTCTITERYRHSEDVYAHPESWNHSGINTLIVIPTSNKKLISTLKLCL